MLTKKQRALLLFIHERISQEDVPPTFEEMKQALDLKSKSGIHRLITALVERGFIERLPHRARALEVLRLPPGLEAQTQSVNHQATSANSNFEEVPLYGKIAAGTAIEAISHEGETIQVPSGYVGQGEYYALIVEGDSMIEAGIHDQDTVIIRRTDRAENGDIIVALVDDQEVTLKRLRRAGGKIVLEPENANYEPMVLEPERVRVQGILASLLRSYH